jgi:predicted amidohydrolase
MTSHHSLPGLPGLTISSPLYTTSTSFTLPEVTVISPGLGRWKQQDVFIQDDRIVSIGNSSNEKTESSNILHDYAGSYVLPGLVDLHTHLPPDNALKLTPYMSLLYLLQGVTTVRDTGDGDGTSIAAAQKGILSHQFPGPRVFFCGPYVGGEPKR